MFVVLTTLLGAASILFFCALLLLALRNTVLTNIAPNTDLFLVFGSILVSSLLIDHWYNLPTLTLLFVLYVGILSFWLVTLRFPHHTAAGIFFYTTHLLLSATLLPWSLLFILGLDISAISTILLVASMPLLILTLPFNILYILESYDVLCRHTWLRPRATKPLQEHEPRPFVSIHVPTYAEPPEIVIATLNSIAQLSYKNYEVLVIDNNTKDETLWRPVAQHCQKLGPHFRFFHVDPLSGAKAGALNFALTQTDPRAEIISIMDADYQPNSQFLSDLLGHFTDPTIGFVQTPHDYRDWEHSTYLSMCYWEYKAFFYTVMTALNERCAALTVGTMCLIRKDALQTAGGWSTWCVTEDSELAIRIHDAGYRSVYVAQPYGRGLIPERFVDYAKQRHRWIAGPAQELHHHLRRYLNVFATDSHLTPTQRLHHFNHGLGSVLLGLQLPLLVLGVLIVTSMTLHNEIVPVPFTLWLAITALLTANILLAVLQYRIVLQTSLKNMLLALVAHKALMLTVQLASLKTIINPRQPWLRTNKFSVPQTIWGALMTTKLELLLSTLLISTAIVCFITLPYSGLLTMSLLGLVFKGAEYACAPLVACLAAHEYTQQPAALSYPLIPHRQVTYSS